MQTHKTYCRFCHACCAIEVDVADGVPVAVRGDPSDPVYGGYTCIKGRALPEQFTSPERVTRTLKRRPDGGFDALDTDLAMDQIAQQIQRLIDEHGPRSIATYLGTYGYQNSAAMTIGKAWHDSIGSPSWYTSVTIDQPGKRIAASRIGTWGGGTHKFTGSDVCLIIGSNVVVSQYSRFGGPPPFSPYARIRDEMKKGMQLIVVDPRRTEVASRASAHLQIDPGEDAVLLCGLIRIILDEGLHDEQFCNAYVDGLSELERLVAPFSPEVVAQRCGVDAESIIDAARMFGRARRGVAVGGTGPAMAPDSILTEHLILTLNYICGRVNRAGEQVPNPSVLAPPAPRRAEVVPGRPVHGVGPKARVRGLGEVFGEMPTATLSDEILQDGDGQIRALICLGGNPVVAFPDQEKTRRAMQKLELLVCVDLYRSATARLADYIIAPTTTLEREDVTLLTDTWYDVPYANYTAPVLPKNPQGREEWEIYWELAHRSGLPLELPGGRLDPERRPSKFQVLQLVAPRTRVPLEEVRESGRGQLYPHALERIAPASTGQSQPPARLQLLPDAVADELRQLFNRPGRSNGLCIEDGVEYTHKLICRRLKHVFNSSGQQLQGLQRKGQTNAAYVHPVDLAQLGLQSGDVVEIESAAGKVVGVVSAATDIKPGVVSMAHGWGGAADLADDTRRRVASTNRLVDDDRTYDPITGQPRMSAIPVNLRPLHVQGDAF